MSDYPQNFSSWSQDDRNAWFASAARNYAEKQSENTVGSGPLDFSEAGRGGKRGNSAFTETLLQTVAM